MDIFFFFIFSGFIFSIVMYHIIWNEHFERICKYRHELFDRDYNEWSKLPPLDEMLRIKYWRRPVNYWETKNKLCKLLKG